MIIHILEVHQKPTPMITEDPTLYNQVTVKNIDDEDFVFTVNREKYLIKAGEVRVFPKFMVSPMLKHLIDRLLIKEEPTGAQIRNKQKRDALSNRIVMGEEAYQKPIVPTERQMVDEMNDQPELDRVLERNRKRAKAQDDQPKAEEAPAKESEFDQIKQEAKQKKVKGKIAKTKKTDKNIPTRDEMMTYAADVLKMDTTNSKNKKALDDLDDATLYHELGMDDL